VFGFRINADLAAARRPVLREREDFIKRRNKNCPS
jgi:hypothetical protein